MNFFKKYFEKLNNSLPAFNGFFISFFSLYFLFPKFSIFNFNCSLYHHITIIIFAVFFIYALLKSKFKVSVNGVFFTLLILLFSNFLNREYSLLQGPIIKGEIIFFSFFSYILLKLGFKKIFYILLAIAPIFLITIFLLEANKGMIWSDDNPTFLYRLSLLKDFFPNIPFYYTRWNAGLDARDFFATGALNIFLVSYPLIKFIDITKYFDIIHAYLLFIFLPLCVYISCKILKKDFKTSCIAVALALSSSLFWYRWALKYGTLGFITSTSLLLIVFTLSQKLLSKDEELNALEAILFVIATSLMLLWSLTGVVFVPIIFCSIILIKSLFKKKYFLRILLSLLIINIPIILIFLSVSKVGGFIANDNLISSKKIEKIEQDKQNPTNIFIKYKEKLEKPSYIHNVKIFYKNIKDAFTCVNPLLILFSVIGVMFLSKSYRISYYLTFIWLIFLGSFVSFFLPQLELNRMFVVLSILCAIPTACFIEKVINTEFKFKYIYLSLILGILFAGIFSTGKIFKQRSTEIYKRQNENIINLITFLKNYKTKERVLFSGFVLHDFSDGHIAPLTVLTDKNLIASSPFHNVWRYTEVLPKEFLIKNDIESYLKLMNVGLVVAHEKKWRDYFLNNKEDYKLEYEFNNYKIFKYKNLNPSYILKGNASNIKINKNNITLIPKSNEIILKFNYFNFLQSSNCDIMPFKATDSITFIKLTNCNLNKKTRIKSKNVFKRVFIKNEKNI